MLGIRLSEEAEARLARFARDSGRPKSVVARDWIMERLDRDDIDELIKRAVKIHNEAFTAADRQAACAATDDHLRLLDVEDGGYDWGPQGPPPVR